jgi:hypothetical protein
VPASPGANPALVNDLNLRVTDPSDNVYWGNYGLDSAKWSSSGGTSDNKNNVENVFIQNPQAGTWSIEVIGANIVFEGDPSTTGPDQTYSLVASNAIGRLAVNISDPSDGEWVKDQVTISGISRGPVTRVEVKIDGGPWEIASGTINWNLDWDTTIASDGGHTIFARAFNGTDYSDVESITLYVDNTKPTTTLSVGSPSYFNGSWWFAVLTTPFTLNGNDAGGSGIANNWYRILYESTQVVPWTTGSSFMLSWGAGEYVVQYYSEDNMGNIEDFKTVEVLVDLDPPQTALTVTEPKYRGSPTDNWNVSIFTTFDLNPASDETGIAYKWYKIDGQYFEGETFDLLGFSENWYYIEWGSCDHLGHNETGNSDWVFLDRSPPTLSVIEGTPSFREYLFNWLNVTNETSFSIDSSDSISGVDFDWYIIDGDFYTGSVFTLNGYENGTYSIQFGAQDNVANNKSLGPYIYNLDLDPPTTVLEIGKPSYRESPGDLWTVSKTTDFDLWPTDKFSGVQLTWYEIDGNYHEGSYNEHIRFDLATLSSDGPHIIEWASRDNLSQEEYPSSITVILDSQGPVTGLTVGEPRYRNGDQDIWNITLETEFTLSSNDTYSGVNMTWYAIDGNYYEDTLFNLSGLSNGYHTITWGARDNLGNLEDENSQMVYLSNNLPQTTIEILGDKYRDSVSDSYNVTDETHFMLTTSEVHTGVSTVWYTINGNYFEGNDFDLSGMSDGLYILTWGAMDNLGMNETVNTVHVYLDTLSPLVDFDIGEPNYFTQGTDSYSVNADTDFWITSMDYGSGVDHNWYTIDGVLKRGSTFSLGVYTEGPHTITWGSVDNLGHNELKGTIIIDLDLSPPEVSIHVGEPSISDDDTVYLTSTTPISFNYMDTGVNLTSIYYSIDGGSHFILYESPFTVPKKTTSIIYWGQDILGNKAQDMELDLVVDDTDTDSDGIVDLADDDDDNDGLLDTHEDTNGNGKVDAHETDPKDPDTDSDGYSDFVDTFPLDKTRWNGNGNGDGLIFIIIGAVVAVVLVIIILLFIMLQKKGKGEVEWEKGQQAPPAQSQQVAFYAPPQDPQIKEVEFETEEDVEFESYR